jgi:UDP-2-acetamido-3-amino-2,3-dideoxy-glucuronate N-acetyltransferase
MAIFNDVAPYGEKLVLYPQTVEFEGDMPILRKEDAQLVEYPDAEPLREECLHFVDSVASRNRPLTDSQSGIDVLKVLHGCQSSINQNGVPITL